MEALVQTQEAFIFRHPSVPRTDVVPNSARTMLFNHPSYPVSVPTDVVVRGGDSGGVSSRQNEEEGDHSDAMYKYISQMLMEEDDLENKPCMLRDCMALQAAEKYFSDVLNGSENSNVLVPQEDLISNLTSSSSDSVECPQWDLTRQ